ncbi:Prephenate dehydratase-domain-containing protein [Fimicolochytrium jonesii]|uniref:Prephenate dehydratase-domain-containing protein n=1 Tax=Fimicolochytrium jonesii TaxID=1396493 RepID=UPI0022FE219D|nr:Prephenate dehydratase-domain-containing protein [Fimicolochytrium jonesii]KAI8823106.1 Prephenate dehydratase-domain-containing protein [Fimicolochytrium jonesii]
MLTKISASKQLTMSAPTQDTPGELPRLRARVDTLDAELVRLLNERASISVGIGLAKRKDAEKTGGVADEHIHRPSREMQIYERLETLNSGPLPTSAIQSIFREVMSASISLQKETTIAFLGPRGTYSHQAAFERFGDSCQYVEQETIKDVFDAVAGGSVTYGVVPFENSRFGSVQPTLDVFCALPGGKVQIRAEHYLAVHHVLLRNKDTTRGQIRKIYSHAQGFGQCQTFLNQHMRGVERVNVSSTAKAAELASREHGAAAICSLGCASIYGLDVEEKNIEDAADNTTRFFILGNASDMPSGNDRTLVFFTVDHRQPGALCDALNTLKTRNINLTKIDSRPSGQRPWHYFFFLELTGHMADEQVKAALADMNAFCLDITMLGSYPAQQP